MTIHRISRNLDLQITQDGDVSSAIFRLHRYRCDEDESFAISLQEFDKISREVARWRVLQSAEQGSDEP